MLDGNDTCCCVDWCLNLSSIETIYKKFKEIFSTCIGYNTCTCIALKQCCIYKHYYSTAKEILDRTFDGDIGTFDGDKKIRRCQVSHKLILHFKHKRSIRNNDILSFCCNHLYYDTQGRV